MSSIGMTNEELSAAIADPLDRISQCGSVITFIEANNILNAMRDATLEIDSDKGGANHGHLGILLPDAEYFQLTTNHWQDEPDPLAFTLPTGTNAEGRARFHHEW